MRLLYSSRLSVVCVLIAAGKLLLVAQNEILSISDDSAGYVRQSLRPWSLDFPPGYSTWLRATRALGVPQRIEIECLYLFSAALVAMAVRRCFGPVAGVVTFALLAFTPATFFLFDHALSDGLYTCLTLLCVAINIRLFMARRKGSVLACSLGLGLLFGVMASTRNEDPLTAFWIVSLILTCAALWHTKGGPIVKWESWSRPIMAGVITTGVTFAVVFSVEFSYYLADGVFARSISLLPGHAKLLENLARIDTRQPQLKWIPISRKSRELAYAVSPTFAGIRNGIEDPMSDYQIASRTSGLPNGELGGGWIWHAINAQVLPLSAGRLTNTEAFYERINRELKAAFDDHRLKRRFILHALLGADLAGVASRIPASIVPVVTSTFSALPDYVQDQEFQSEMFDQALLRRSALIERPPQVVIQGWAFINIPGRKLLNAFVASGNSIPSQIQSMQRPDVEKVFLIQNGWKPNVLGFSASVESRVPENVTIHYLLDNGTEAKASGLKPLQVSSIGSKDKPGSQIVQGIDLVQTHAYAQGGFGYRMQLRLLSMVQLRAFSLAATVVVTLAFLLNGYLWLRRRDEQRKFWTIVFTFIFALWWARIFFYSVLDAAAWEGDQIRYLAPAHVLGVVLVAISITCLLQFATSPRAYVLNKLATTDWLAQGVPICKEC